MSYKVSVGSVPAFRDGACQTIPAIAFGCKWLQIPSAWQGRGAESAVEEPLAPGLSLKLSCFHLGSEEIPAGITPEPKELGPELTL